MRVPSSRRTPRARSLAIALTELALWSAISGCAMGPARQKVLGCQCAATRAWPDEPEPPCGGLAAACGAGADAGLTLADTVMVPVGAVGMAGAFGLYGPDPHFDEFPPGIIFLPMGILYFALGLAVSPIFAWELSYGWDFGGSTPPANGATPAPVAEPPAPTPTALPGPLPDELLRE